MTKKYPTEDEIERLSQHYEELDDEDLHGEWERGEPVTIDVREPMVSRSVRFSRQTMDRLHNMAPSQGHRDNPANTRVDRRAAAGRRPAG